MTWMRRKKIRKKGWGQREFMFKGGRKGRNELGREGEENPNFN